MFLFIKQLIYDEFGIIFPSPKITVYRKGRQMSISSSPQPAIYSAASQ